MHLCHVRWCMKRGMDSYVVGGGGDARNVEGIQDEPGELDSEQLCTVARKVGISMLCCTEKRQALCNEW